MQPPDSVKNLQQSMIRGGTQAFDLVPTCLKNVIEGKQWAAQLDKNGEPFKSFEEFVRHPLYWGLESSSEDLLRFCHKRSDVVELIKREMPELAAHGEIGNGRSRGDNITSTDRGTNYTYTLRRLKRDRPELAEKVMSGELSANAAAIEAGFRKQPSPWERIVKLIPKLSPEQISELRKLLDAST